MNVPDIARVQGELSAGIRLRKHCLPPGSLGQRRRRGISPHHQIDEIIQQARLCPEYSGNCGRGDLRLARDGWQCCGGVPLGREETASRLQELASRQRCLLLPLRRVIATFLERFVHVIYPTISQALTNIEYIGIITDAWAGPQGCVCKMSRRLR